MFDKFQKISRTQNLLVTMLEKWKKAVDKREYVSALLMDLSKAFDTVNHDFLFAKLKAYVFSLNAVKLMRSYLKNRKQQVKINNKFSSAGVPQGSIDGPLFFNLFINDLVFLYNTVLYVSMPMTIIYFLWVKTKMK